MKFLKVRRPLLLGHRSGRRPLLGSRIIPATGQDEDSRYGDHQEHD